MAGATLRKLVSSGATCLRPKLQPSGRWRKADVSARKAAALRKQAIIKGNFGPRAVSLEEGGWDSRWDTPRTPWELKPLKGTKRSRTREARAQKITENLAKMPQKEEAYRKEVQSRKPETGILPLIAKLFLKADKRPDPPQK